MSTVLKRTSCFWTFELGHSNTCPACGRYNTRNVESVDQQDWVKRKTMMLEESVLLESKTIKCCFTAEHTRGFNHDNLCPNFVMVY